MCPLSPFSARLSERCVSPALPLVPCAPPALLEAEMLGMIAGGDYHGPGVSPDRADAMVWGLTELMLGREKAVPRVRGL